MATYSVNTTNTTHRLGRIYTPGASVDTYVNYRYFARCALSGTYPETVVMETSDGSITQTETVPSGGTPSWPDIP